MLVRVYTDYTPVKVVIDVNGAGFDDIVEKNNIVGAYEDIDDSLLPDRKYRNEWRKKDSGGLEVPENLKKSRDAIIELNKIDEETGFDRSLREVRIAAGIAEPIEIEKENLAKILRRDIVK